MYNSCSPQWDMPRCSEWTKRQLQQSSLFVLLSLEEAWCSERISRRSDRTDNAKLRCSRPCRAMNCVTRLIRVKAVVQLSKRMPLSTKQVSPFFYGPRYKFQLFRIHEMVFAFHQGRMNQAIWPFISRKPAFYSTCACRKLSHWIWYTVLYDGDK